MILRAVFHCSCRADVAVSLVVNININNFTIYVRMVDIFGRRCHINIKLGVRTSFPETTRRSDFVHLQCGTHLVN